MEQEVENFARFYALLKKMPGADKEELVWQFTDGRTRSLREMRAVEYERMCRDMERVAGYDERMEALRRELRRQRSVCLKLMQQMGIDTSDWTRVNDFCRDARIVGKEFAKISGEELEALAVKLRSIKRKGGLKGRPQQVAALHGAEKATGAAGTSRTGGTCRTGDGRSVMKGRRIMSVTLKVTDELGS